MTARAPSFLEQRVECLPRVVRRLRLARLVVRQVPHHLGLEERTFVATMLVGHARRNVLAALPHRGGVEEAAIAAGVDVRAALHADLLEGGKVEADALLTAAIALENFRAEAARSPPA